MSVSCQPAQGTGAFPGIAVGQTGEAGMLPLLSGRWDRAVDCSEHLSLIVDRFTVEQCPGTLPDRFYSLTSVSLERRGFGNGNGYFDALVCKRNANNIS